MLNIKEILFLIILILSVILGLFLIIYSLLSKKERKALKILYFITGMLFVLCGILYKFNLADRKDLEAVYPIISIVIVALGSAFIRKEK